MKSVQKFKAASIQILLYLLIVILLLVSALNVKNILTPIKVLGIESTLDSSQEFWGEFTAKNPGYIPGWIELGKTERAQQIDPNFISTP